MGTESKKFIDAIEAVLTYLETTQTQKMFVGPALYAEKAARQKALIQKYKKITAQPIFPEQDTADKVSKLKKLGGEAKALVGSLDKKIDTIDVDKEYPLGADYAEVLKSGLDGDVKDVKAGIAKIDQYKSNADKSFKKTQNPMIKKL